MNGTATLFSDPGFARILLESIPCGVLVMDREGRIQAVNNIIERVLSTSEHTVVGKTPGDAFGCLHSSESPEGCGFSEFCKDCDLRRAASTALFRNEKIKTKIFMELVIDNQVRDLTLLLEAVPFTFDNQQFAVIIIEDITKIRAINPPDTKKGYRGLVGRDDKMHELFETIREIAPTDAPVLLQGESGTGKELVALAIHKESPRARKKFVPVNCGALPEGLLETELFGHVKGAFTGAIRDKKGRFELADGGTIFLDEIGELSPTMQVKLLRVLQDGCLERVGSEETLRVDARVISSSNRDLEAEVASEHFRKDLYYRLCVMPVSLPPLREKRGDIPLLADHFVAQYARKSFGKKVTISPMALTLLTNHTWPGNVRELQNALQFALAKCRGDMIEPNHLPLTLYSGTPKSPTVSRRNSKLQEVDVDEALKRTEGNKRQAARLLGVSRSSLYRFFDGHKII